MFSKWIESAKESATKILSTSKSVINTVCRLWLSIFQSVQQFQAASNECKIRDFSCDVVSDKANAYLRDNIIKTPKDMTYITNNLIGKQQ